MWSTPELEPDDCDCPPPGLPTYMGTFADLMALLLCFFVLLLSFAELDAMKFRRLAGSMAQAFGVQSELRADQVPMGTSIIAQEFSPGVPDPSPLATVMQHTDDLPELTLETQCSEAYRAELGQPDTDAGSRARLIGALQEKIEETRRDAADLAHALHDQIARGEVEVETRGRRIVVRIQERGSFASGSAQLAEDYVDVLERVRDVLLTKSGAIQVHGHTDNVPIGNAGFRSNWDLSAARAASVAHELLAGGLLSPGRLQVVGFADTRPLADNGDPAGRAANRRVEIVIRQGLGDELEKDLMELKSDAPEAFRSLESRYQFELQPSEIF